MKYAFLFLLFFSFLGFSQELKQNNLYLDEDLKTIDTTTYALKCKQNLKKCLEYVTDSLVVYKVLNKFKFDKFKPENYEQIRFLLNRDSKKNISNGETIVLKYYDSLQNFATANKKHVVHLNKFKKNTVYSSKLIESHSRSHVFNQKIFQKDIIKWAKKHNKCIKKYEKKFPIKINYVYKYEQNIVNSYSGFNWIKDNGVFKNTFFNIMYNYNLLILKPNGEYFLSGGHLTDRHIEKLIKNTDWTTFKNDLKISEEKHSTDGYGLFEKIPVNHHSKHCF